MRYVTLDHKINHKGYFGENLIYTSSEIWINKLSINVWFTYYCYLLQYLAEIQLFENLYKNINIEKIAFTVVQIKFLAMHITNQQLHFNIFTKYLHGVWSLLNILTIFGIK